MVGTEIIERTVKVGGNGYRDGTSRSIERATADQGGGGVPIALPNHKWMAARYSHIGKVVNFPGEKQAGGKVRSVSITISKIIVR